MEYRAAYSDCILSQSRREHGFDSCGTIIAPGKEYCEVLILEEVSVGLHAVCIVPVAPTPAIAVDTSSGLITVIMFQMKEIIMFRIVILSNNLSCTCICNGIQIVAQLVG